MGIIFNVILPFAIGAELMDAWDERTTDPSVLRLRAQKRVERRAALLGIDPAEFATKSSQKSLDAFTFHIDEMKRTLQELKDKIHSTVRSEPKEDQSSDP